MQVIKIYSIKNILKSFWIQSFFGDKVSKSELNTSGLIERLEKERGEEVLKASRQLFSIVSDYDVKIEALQEVVHLRKNGKELSKEQYEEVAKLFCSEYFIRNGEIIDHQKPICKNCHGAYEDCLTHGIHKIAEILIL